MNPRNLLLAAVAASLALWGAWQLYAGWGLVSLDFENAPVGKVLAAISRQGGIEIATNLDPATPVTIKVRRVLPLEALDIVAVRTDASWRAAYLGAPDEPAIEAALAEFRAGRENPAWLSHGAPGFGMLQPSSGQPLDLRLVEWNPEGPGPLHDLLDSAAEKTGIYLAAPSDWQPTVAEPPAGRMADAAPELFRRAGGVSREIFLLRGRGDREAAGEDGDQGWRGGGTWIGATPSRGARRRGPGDPERIAERVAAQIKLLPVAEQAKAREEADQMRQFWKSVRDLPEEERRAKAREFFSRPEVQERMEDRRLAREAKMSPQQRIERAKRYWDRKAESKYRRDPNP